MDFDEKLKEILKQLVFRLANVLVIDVLKQINVGLKMHTDANKMGTNLT